LRAKVSIVAHPSKSSTLAGSEQGSTAQYAARAVTA
jgi:hypothetical protein